jgi:membrane-bound ClpP family serine protease
MASAVKPYKTILDIFQKVHDFASDTLKFLLSNTAITQSTVNAISDVTEITAHNGYSAGGVTSPQISSAQSSGTYKLVLTDEVITASGGTIGPFEYIVLTNSTASKVVQYYDYGSAITLADTETFTIDVDGTNGTIQAS